MTYRTSDQVGESGHAHSAIGSHRRNRTINRNILQSFNPNLEGLNITKRNAREQARTALRAPNEAS